MPNKRRIVFYALSILFLSGITLISHVIDRSQSIWLMLTFLTSFGAYLVIWRSEFDNSLYSIGILARVILLFSFPSLSDDVYRFLWDGFLLKAGINPFLELPSHYVHQEISGLSRELFSNLNSPEYFTVYPPLNQGIFWLAVTISSNWLLATGVIRLFLLAADIGTVYYLKKIFHTKGLNGNLAYLYFLNPLLILEGVGNLHFEGLVILFLTISIHYINSNKSIQSGIGMGLAIGTKLLPLIFLHYYFLKDLSSKKFTLSVVSFVTALLVLSPLFSSEFIEGMRSSLTLYFRNFEFNASIYFLAREVAFMITGYNEIEIIGPILSLISFVSILAITIIGYSKKWPVEKVFLMVLTSYLLCSTTVHPWYILPLLLFGILSGYIYPIIWSLIIFITYMGYASEEYFLSMEWIVTEYFIVFLAFIFNKKLKKWLIIS